MDKRIREVRQTSEGSVYLKDEQGNIAGFSGNTGTGVQDAQSVYLLGGYGPLKAYFTTEKFPEDAVVIFKAED
jgi:hypothetical protein